MASGTAYTQIPLMLTLSLNWHLDNGLGFFTTLASGVDFSNLQSRNRVYFTAKLTLGMMWRFAEHWSIRVAAEGALAWQPVPDDKLYSSATYSINPLIGLSLHF